MRTAVDSVSETPSTRLRLAYMGVLVGLIAIGYGGVVSAFFVADDFNYLNIALPAQTFAKATGIEDGWVFFRPLTGISFWVNALLFGKNPTSYHLVGLLFHGINAFLVARLTWQLFANRAGAAIGGMCFAVFPVHPEALTWISARADVLCATGTLLCVSGFLNFLRAENRTLPLVETLFGFVWALAAKDSAMVMPIVLLLVLGCSRDRQSPGRRRQTLYGFGGIVLLFVAYLVVRFSVLGGFGGHPGEEGSRHLQIDLPTATRFAVDAVRCMFMPGTTTIAPLTCLVLILALGGMMIRHASPARFTRLTWPMLAIFFLLLAPVANIMVIDLETAQQTRFLYTPSAFACTALGVLVGTTAAAHNSRLLYGVGLLLVLGYTVNVCLENRRWRRAGDQVESILQQLEEITKKRHYSEVFIHGLPDSVEGASVFRNGFDTAIKWFVDEDLVFKPRGKISRSDWDKFSAMRRDKPDFNPDLLLVRWDPVAQRLVLP